MSPENIARMEDANHKYNPEPYIDEISEWLNFFSVLYFVTNLHY